MEEQILFHIYESLKEGKPVAMAVITEEIGSSPRKSGSMMAVWEDGHTIGTVGGGKIELTVIDQALECIKKRENTTFEYQLTEKDLGMVCGGMVKGYIKVFNPKPRLIIVGAGHIGEKLNQLAKVLDFYTVLIDSREEYANKERLKEADEIIVLDISTALKEYTINKEDFVVIVTKSHDEDLLALKEVMQNECAYVGMIGSTRKIRYVMNELKNQGLNEEDLKRVYAPMGLDIAKGTPDEIALSILSEILLVKNNGSTNHRRDLRKVWD